MSNPQIIFTKNLNPHIKALCDIKNNIIVIDSEFEHSPLLQDIINHEMNHYRILHKALSTKSRLLKKILFAYNDVWDYFSCMKIAIKYYYGERRTG